MLYIVATPIGHFEDITLRALRELQHCDYLLCEDTRHSRPFLQRHGIDKPLVSYHKFNEAARLQAIVDDLKQGKRIGLLSDAGTPGIADPGALLIQRCIQEGLPVSPLPGPCALIAALAGSGLSTERFQFVGFLPRKDKELRKLLKELLRYPGSSVCYESPHRLVHTLELLQQEDSQRAVVVARELTKAFEEFVRGTAAELFDYWRQRTIKGEIVLLIAGQAEEPRDNWDALDPAAHVQQIQEVHGVSKQEAIKIAADLRGVKKRELYQQIHQLLQDEVDDGDHLS